MKRFLLGGSVAAAITFGALPAQADLDDRLSEAQITFRVGGYIPFEKALRDKATVWINVGGDLEMNFSLFKEGMTVLSLDWMTNTGGKRNNIFPVMLSQRYYSGHFGQRTYFHVGLGVAFVDLVPSDAVFGLKAGIGMEWTENTIAEANLFWMDETKGGAKAMGVTVSAGIRF